MASLSIALFGNIEIALNNTAVTFPTDKALALFVYLAVESDRVHRREALAGYLWPDQPQEKALQNLRQAFTQLRKILPNKEGHPPFLIVDRQTAQFNVNSDHWMDVAEYRSINTACKVHRHRKSDRCLPCFWRFRKMIDLYKGDFLAQFHASDSNYLNDWVILTRESLHRAAYDALDKLISAAEQSGEIAQGIDYAWRQVAHDPWREESHAVLMRLLGENGQRSAALSQYEHCRSILLEELGVEPARKTVQLYERILADGYVDSTCKVSDGTGQLPFLTGKFVGRAQEFDELVNWMSDSTRQLITIVGQGGVGKSRLAVELARAHHGFFSDGSVFVPLASVESQVGIIPSLVEAMHMPVVENRSLHAQVCDFLRGKKMLIVLDNLEHLVDNLDDLNDLLSGAPEILFLATSRERLRLQQEWVYPLECLEVPSLDADAAVVASCGSAALFEQRALQANPGFRIHREAGTVAEICCLVDGLPLAIELSAAWVGLRSCEAIARDLKQSLTRLSSPLRNAPVRHRSVLAAFDTSWVRLSTVQQGILARLSVFRGGFETEMACEVTAVAETQLMELADKSLLRWNNAKRYDLHELIRQFASEKLDLDPAARRQAEERHAQVFGAWIANRSQRFQAGNQQEVLQEVGLELENLHAAWRWLLENPVHGLLDAYIDGLYEFHSLLGRFDEAVILFEPAHQNWREQQALKPAWTRMRARQAVFLYRLGRYADAQVALNESYEASQQLAQSDQQCFCLIQMALIALAQGQPEKVRRYSMRVLKLTGDVPLSADAARAFHLLGKIENQSGNWDKARRYFGEGLQIAERLENQILRLVHLNALGDLACYTGDYDDAKSIFDECVSVSQQLGDRFHYAIHLNNLGTVYHQLEQFEHADRLYEQSLNACREMGDRAGQAIALSNRGEIALILDQYDQAERYFSEGLSIADAMGDTNAAIVCMNNLGKVHGLGNRAQLAREYLLKALKPAVESQAWTLVASILLNCAELLLREGQQWDAACLLKLLSVEECTEMDQKVKAMQLLETVPAQDCDQFESLEQAACHRMNQWSICTQGK
jgi:predicted ATPase/DNA-binding SARP family transcriptional activator/Tfp pilus assembly protein PilF